MSSLYKKNSKGEILIWRISNRENYILIESGKLNGKLAATGRKITEGKNIGKANETSIDEQSHSEVESLIHRKKRQGYKSLEDLNVEKEDTEHITLDLLLQLRLPKDSTDLEGNIKPMKCQQYYRSKPNWTDPTGKVWKDRKYYYLLNPDVEKEPNAIIIKFPCLIQPKINGVRATVSLDDSGQVQILSKEGLKYNIPHIEKEFKSLPFEYTQNNETVDLIYDGELYIHGEPLQNITSAVKSNNMFSSNIVFICFDLILPTYQNLMRYEILKYIIKSYDRKYIFKIPTFMAYEDKHVQARTNIWIGAGYEGSICRHPNALYEAGKRPMTMVKLKRIISKEFKITDIVPQDKNPELGMYQCITPEGEYFDATATISNEQKEVLLITKHQYIGQMLTVDFYEYTEKGIPFHIVNTLIRDYE